MSGPTRETRLIEALVTLADTLVAGYDVVELLHYLVDVSVELLDAAAAGLVLADGDGQLDVLASTSERTELLEVLQIRTGRGRASSATPPASRNRSLTSPYRPSGGRSSRRWPCSRVSGRCTPCRCGTGTGSSAR